MKRPTLQTYRFLIPMWNVSPLEYRLKRYAARWPRVVNYSQRMLCTEHQWKTKDKTERWATTGRRIKGGRLTGNRRDLHLFTVRMPDVRMIGEAALTTFAACTAAEHPDWYKLPTPYAPPPIIFSTGPTQRDPKTAGLTRNQFYALQTAPDGATRLNKLHQSDDHLMNEAKLLNKEWTDAKGLHVVVRCKIYCVEEPEEPWREAMNQQNAAEATYGNRAWN